MKLFTLRCPCDKSIFLEMTAISMAVMIAPYNVQLLTHITYHYGLYAAFLQKFQLLSQ